MFGVTKILSALAAVVLGSTMVQAHGHIVSWTVNGQVKPGFNPSWPPAYGRTAGRPTDNSDQGFTDYTTGKVACGGSSPGTNLDTWNVDAGSTVTAQWDQWPESHKGPVIEYMAECPPGGCNGVDAASLDWFKIAQDIGTGTRWASETIVQTHKWSFTIPRSVAPGNYLIRHEIVAMHTPGAPQVYPYCFQANVASSGTLRPGNTVRFPAAYTINEQFKSFNLYGGLGPKDFTPPGPPVFNAGLGPVIPPASSSSVGSSSSRSASSSSTSKASTAFTSSAKSTSSASKTTSSVSKSTSTSKTSSTSKTTSVKSTSKASTLSALQTVSPTASPGKPEMGGPAPAVIKKGERWETNGGSYHDKQSAVTASCMWQMNRCKDWANSLPNAQVSSAFARCDQQTPQCIAAGNAARRDVLNRYSKRELKAF